MSGNKSNTALLLVLAVLILYKMPWIKQPCTFPKMLVLLQPFYRVAILCPLGIGDVLRTKLPSGYGEVLVKWSPLLYLHQKGILHGPECSSWDILLTSDVTISFMS